MNRIVAAAIAAAGLALAASGASAEDWPDLTGVWTGVSHSVVRGDPPHHRSTEAAGDVRISEREFIMRIDGQEGRNVWGTFESSDSVEGVVGAIASDRRTIHMADTDGYSYIELVDADTLEVCYVLSAPELQVASCSTMTRQP